MSRNADSSAVRVGAILGPPPKVDPARPNRAGGATPHFPGINGISEPTDYPLFSTTKECRVCGCGYVGWSSSPQYDDSNVFYGWCGCQRRPQGQPTQRKQPELATTAPVNHGRDILDD